MIDHNKTSDDFHYFLNKSAKSIGLDINRKLEVYEHEFMTALVSKFGTYLDTPEEIVVS